MDMLEAAREVGIDRIEACDDSYTIHITVNKERFHEWLKLFECLSYLGDDMHRKHRRADEAMMWKKNYQKDIEERDKGLRDKMRAMYNEAFKEFRSEREAMKVITREFKEWWWIRQRFKKEVEAARDLKAMKLHDGGLSSRQIAARLGLHPATVRSIIVSQARP